MDGSITFFPAAEPNMAKTPEQTARRESHEELGLRVEIDRLVAEVTYHGRTQYYFLAHQIGGRFGTGQGPEMLGKYPLERGTYTPIWMPISRLLQINLVPPAIAELVHHCRQHGWPETVQKFHDDGP